MEANARAEADKARVAANAAVVYACGRRPGAQALEAAKNAERRSAHERRDLRGVGAHARAAQRGE